MVYVFAGHYGACIIHDSQHRHYALFPLSCNGYLSNKSFLALDYCLLYFKWTDNMVRDIRHAIMLQRSYSNRNVSEWWSNWWIRWLAAYNERRKSSTNQHNYQLYCSMDVRISRCIKSCSERCSRLNHYVLPWFNRINFSQRIHLYRGKCDRRRFQILIVHRAVILDRLSF